MEDVYDDDEPNLVCCAHVVDLEDDKGANVPDFVTDANNNAEKQRLDHVLGSSLSIQISLRILNWCCITLHKESCTIALKLRVYFTMYLAVQSLSVIHMVQMVQSQSLATLMYHDISSRWLVSMIPLRYVYYTQSYWYRCNGSIETLI